jgi:hypothetical protein
LIHIRRINSDLVLRSIAEQRVSKKEVGPILRDAALKVAPQRIRPNGPLPA